MDRADRIEFREIRNVAEILNVTFDFLRQNFRLLAKALLRFALPPVLVAVIVFSYFFVDLINVAIDGSLGEEEAISRFLLLFLVTMLGGLLLAVGFTLLTCIVHVFARLYLERTGEAFTLEDIWRGTREIFWMVFGTMFGLGIVIFILSVLAAFIPFGQLGIYVIYTFGALYFPLRIYEERGFLQSFVVSSNLVQGRWWATLGLVMVQYLMANILGGLLLFLPLLVFVILVGVCVIYVDQIQSNSWIVYVGVAVLALYMALLVLLSAVPTLSMIFHYYSQKERKEAPGLMERVGMIGADEEPGTAGAHSSFVP